MEEKTYYKGLAFVVGMDEFDHVEGLDNAVYDARSIENKLMALHFNVISCYNVSLDKFIDKLEDFKNELSKYNVGVFYFAGHGIEVSNTNYLIFRDTPFEPHKPEKTIAHAYKLQRLIQIMHDTSCKMNVLIIDACRNNPFAGMRGLPSITLAPIFAPKGTIIAYSTSPGETACDGGLGKNSVYTGALLKHMDEEGLEIEQFFKKVRTTVSGLTSGGQTSWEHTSLIGSFSFNSGRMVQTMDLGYRIDAISDSEWDDAITNEIVSLFKAYNWDKQKSATDKFLSLNGLNKDQLFVIGRNLLQAADGDSFYCQDFLKDSDNLAEYTDGNQNHLLNGILFEIYFDNNGNFRYNQFKHKMLPLLMNYKNFEKLKCSFDFIEKTLLPYKDNMLFIPSQNPLKVSFTMSLHVEDIGSKLWRGYSRLSLVADSLSSNGVDLLTDDDNEAFSEFKWKDFYTNINSLKEKLSELYAIPEKYLDVITNEVEGADVECIYFEHKLKRLIKP